ncbi:MAG: Gfo/Idh/MocA family oxidoreductase [Bacteroidota bacterium]
MKPINVGVIGVGHLGALHAKMLAQIDGVHLIGVQDDDDAKTRRVAEDLGVQPFARYEDLLQQVDALTIATNTPSHSEIARTALQRGKHVFIEKPITETVREAEELCSLAGKSRLCLQVGHIERFNPALLALERYEIRPLFVESHRLSQFNPRGSDVAVVLDLMIHDIDVILSLVRSPVKQVEANGVAVVSDSVDIANARLQFENGCVANVTASRISQRRMRKMRLFQPSSYISVDFSEGLAEVFRLVDEDEPEVEGTMMLGRLDAGSRKRKIVYEQPEVKEKNALLHEMELFVDAIRSGTPPLVSGEDGRRALEVASVIMEKISQQQQIFR